MNTIYPFTLHANSSYFTSFAFYSGNFQQVTFKYSIIDQSKYLSDFPFDATLKISHHHHHHISITELGHFLAHSGLTYPEVSSKVYHVSFCQLASSISLPWVMYFETFYLHVLSSFSCIPVICPNLVLFLTPLQFVHFFCFLGNNLPKHIIHHS